MTERFMQTNLTGNTQVYSSSSSPPRSPNLRCVPCESPVDEPDTRVQLEVFLSSSLSNCTLKVKVRTVLSGFHVIERPLVGDSDFSGLIKCYFAQRGVQVFKGEVPSRLSYSHVALWCRPSRLILGKKTNCILSPKHQNITFDKAARRLQTERDED